MPITGKIRNKMTKKSILLPVFFSLVQLLPVTAQTNEIIVKTKEGKDTINKNIFGHFAEHLGRCIYDGIWVGENSSIPNINGYRKDVVDALKELGIPVLRWPGGCFADTYHWKDGIGPKESRPEILNMFWGDVIEDNSFGTHEFLDLCELIGAEPYLAINVGSGTPKEAFEWIDYVTSDINSPMAKLRMQNGREKPWKVKYWGIGNENWGCGGNMTPEYYADLYKRFATYCRADFKIASGGINSDLEWTKVLMEKTKYNRQLINGMSYHHYTVAHTWENKGSATDFTQEDWFLTIKGNFSMEQNLKEHIAIMDEYDPENRIALIADEWGNWHDVELGTEPGFLYQQNTLRDAVTAAIYLNSFNNLCHRVKMANIAQTVNVLQAMVLTNEKELVKTPTFYVFKMFKVHYDALMLPIELNCEDYINGNDTIPSISVSASKNSKGEINITISNVKPDSDLETSIQLAGLNDFKIIKSEIITADKMNALNDFGKKEEVNIKEFKKAKKEKNQIHVNLPAKSVLLLSLSE